MSDLTDETLAEQETAARNRLSSGDWSVMADANFTLVLIDEVRTLRTDRAVWIADTLAKVEAAEADVQRERARSDAADETMALAEARRVEAVTEVQRLRDELDGLVTTLERGEHVTYEAITRGRALLTAQVQPPQWINADGTTSPIVKATIDPGDLPRPGPSQEFLQAVVAAEQDRLRADGWQACVDYIRREYKSMLTGEDTYWTEQHNPFRAAPQVQDKPEALRSGGMVGTMRDPYTGLPVVVQDKRCEVPMLGFYGAETWCQRPEGHDGDHYQLADPEAFIVNNLTRKDNADDE